MTSTPRPNARLAFAFLGLAAFAGCSRTHSTEGNSELHSEGVAKGKAVAVSYVHPKSGVFERHSTQPGSVQAYESVNLYAKVPGFLRSQSVDIGDVVRRNQVLAVVDVPELVAQQQRAEAAVDQAKSKVTQMKARIATTVADHGTRPLPPWSRPRPGTRARRRGSATGPCSTSG